MNEATRWRYTLAERIAHWYARNPNAHGVMVAGSVGRERADCYSAIAVDVYYAEPPTPEDRIAAVEGCGGVVEAHAPGFDTTPYRANAAKRRPAWDAPPGGPTR